MHKIRYWAGVSERFSTVEEFKDQAWHVSDWGSASDEYSFISMLVYWAEIGEQVQWVPMSKGSTLVLHTAPSSDGRTVVISAFRVDKV